MHKFFSAIGLLFVANVLFSQDLKSQLVGKTYQRTFYALIFKHQARYEFYENKVVYSVNGFFINDAYSIVGQYFSNGFKGENPISGANYVIHIKVVSPQRIRIKKQGVDPKYKDILNDKPVGTWYDYFLKTD